MPSETCRKVKAFIIVAMLAVAEGRHVQRIDGFGDPTDQSSPTGSSLLEDVQEHAEPPVKMTGLKKAIKPLLGKGSAFHVGGLPIRSRVATAGKREHQAARHQHKIGDWGRSGNSGPRMENVNGSSHAPALTLRYFDARGAAEITRILLVLSGQQFTDIRYSIEKKEGGGLSTPEFDADKESGALAANLNRAPVLEVDGQPLGQSKAIERYVAAKGGLMGSTPLEAALIDSVAEHVRDVVDAQRRKGFSIFNRDKSDEEKAQLKDEWYATDLPSWLKRIESGVAPIKSVVCGETPSYAAVCIWALLREGKDEDVALAAKAAEGCDTLNEIAEAVAIHPAVKNWVATRPVTMM